MQYLKHPITAFIVSASLIIPSISSPLDKPAIIAGGSLLGTVLGMGISYYLNEKIQNGEINDNSSKSSLEKIKQFMNKHRALRTFLIITACSAAGALSTYGILALIPAIKSKNTGELTPNHNDYIPPQSDEKPEDKKWWNELTKNSTFKSEAEINRFYQEWNIAIEQHFPNEPITIKFYKEKLNQRVALEKRLFTQSNLKSRN